MEATTLAYLAGALDADGYFSVKRSTYHQRVLGDATNPVYMEVIGLKQVAPAVPLLLQETFGGYVRTEAPQTANSKPLWSFKATDKNAAEACKALLPYLRVKRAQAESLIELRTSKAGEYQRLAYWFAKEHPDWSLLDAVSLVEAASMLGYTHRRSMEQAVRNGSFLVANGRIPRLLIEQYKALSGTNGRSRIRPPQLIAWRERLYNQVRQLNSIGVNGTAVVHRTGVFTPKG